MLSDRGTEASKRDPKQNPIWDVISNLWDPKTNPDGYVSLGVAENSLMHNELRDFLNSKPLVDTSGRAFTYGDGPSGSKLLRVALSNVLNKSLQPLSPIKPDHIMVTNGCTAAIEHCSRILANPGDGILLGRPYYLAFLLDMNDRPEVNVVQVPFDDVDPFGTACVAKYEEAIIRSEAEGVKIRALMLCNPHNPLGQCYSKETVVGLMKLCQKYKIHLVSDEIYALSVWENTVDELKEKPVGFTSVLSVDTQDIIDSSFVHVLWGMSKDFGANGIRLGVIVSQSNTAFLTAARTYALYSSPSALTENAVIALLSDLEFLTSYIETNQSRLSVAYSHAVNNLRKHNIEHRAGTNAAFFLWINLGKAFLEGAGTTEDRQAMEDITQTIYERLMEKKIYLVRGSAAGAEQPGWFRLVFTQAPDLVEEGIRRIANALKS